MRFIRKRHNYVVEKYIDSSTFRKLGDIINKNLIVKYTLIYQILIKILL
jgi:hypothetical protein